MRTMAMTDGLIAAESNLCSAIEAMRNAKRTPPDTSDADQRNLALALTAAEDSLMRLRRACMPPAGDTMPKFGT
jgi:hypothetical protein